MIRIPFSKRVPTWLISLITGLLGTAFCLFVMLPVPQFADVQAARGWGFGAGVFGFLLGFPFSVVAMPLAVELHPYPAGDDVSGAWVVAASVAAIVGVNWAIWGTVITALARAIRRRIAETRTDVVQPSA